MSANVFGERFKLMTFGESHGPALGALIDGCPAGVAYREELLRRNLDRRRPGQSRLTTSRAEPDEAEVLSGLFEGKTLGTPLAVIVRNRDARSGDYEAIRSAPRAGHADDVWKKKFGHSDPRGGGRSSGRETLARVIGGSFAEMYLAQASPDLRVDGWTAEVGPHSLTGTDRNKLGQLSREEIDLFPARFPSERSELAEKAILSARENGDSLGGVAEIRLRGVPAGLGQPVFHKLKADLASAMMSVGATSAVEIGAGIAASAREGLEFHGGSQEVYGGIRGGISTGEDIFLRVHFKPTSSILDVAKKGRHDPFIVTRAVPVLEAMAWLVLADHRLWALSDRI